MKSLGMQRKRRARKVVSGRPASRYVVDCHRLSGSMCQRHISCCQGIGQCPYSKKIDAGSVIHSMGEPNSGIYQVISGVVALMVLDENGCQSLVHLATPGELFGHRSLVAREPHATTAMAVTACQIWHIPAPTARRAYAQDPKFRDVVHFDLARALKVSRGDVHRMVVTNIGDRLLQFLMELGRQIGEPDGMGGVRVAVPLPYQDIAVLLGHPAESISRTLGKLDKRGLLHFDRYNVHIPAATLDQIAEQSLAAAE